jgi:hypothetical protein
MDATLTRFGNIALDWSRVYTVIMSKAPATEKDAHTEEKLVTVVVDAPQIDVGKASLNFYAPICHRVWAFSQADKRFSKFGNFLIDMRRVYAVSFAPDSISFVFPDGRASTIKIDPTTAKLILDAFPDIGGIAAHEKTLIRE